MQLSFTQLTIDYYPYHKAEKDYPLKGMCRTPSVLSQQSKAKLMSSSVVVRLADFNIYQVSTAEQCRSSPKSMICCNKKSLYLPQEMSAVYIEFTEYYYPDGKD
ncbi:UHRF1BP1L isoform 6, partial [Pan troglodytes]